MADRQESSEEKDINTPNLVHDDEEGMDAIADRQEIREDEDINTSNLVHDEEQALMLQHMAPTAYMSLDEPIYDGMADQQLQDEHASFSIAEPINAGSETDTSSSSGDGRSFATASVGGDQFDSEHNMAIHPGETSPSIPTDPRLLGEDPMMIDEEGSGPGMECADQGEEMDITQDGSQAGDWETITNDSEGQSERGDEDDWEDLRRAQRASSAPARLRVTRQRR